MKTFTRPAWMAKPLGALVLCLLVWAGFVMLLWVPWWTWELFLLIAHE
jgi:hypothetical protein